MSCKECVITCFLNQCIYYNEILFCSDPSILDECGLDDETKELLISNIRQKLTSQVVKIRADIEVACYGYEGIDAVKAALKTGLQCSTDEIPIKINLIAPPIYGNIFESQFFSFLLN